MNKVKVYLKILLVCFGGVLILYLIWSFLFNQITTIFNVTVKTERLKFRTVDKNNSRLILRDATIADYDSIIQNNFEGSFELANNVDVIIERISEGPILLTLTCENCQSVGRLFDGESGEMIYKATTFMDIIIEDIQSKAREGITYIFKVDGIIESGRNVAFELYDESNAILREGNIVLIGSSKFNQNYFQAGEERINLGDRIIFDDQDNKGFGFVMINEEPGMKAAYRVSGKRAKIIRPGPQQETSGQVISATYLDRLLKDPFFKGISFIIGILIFIITISTFLIDFLTYRKAE